LGVKNYGSSQAKAAVREQEIHGHEVRRKTDDEVASLPDAARTDELRKWER
jgi:hypothetical protein